ncbi:MAG: hypothetical protein IKC24_09150 [Oscillospiraceae bacterium]|nr:hypothetical protein [Oscillospiraceae bacterium]
MNGMKNNHKRDNSISSNIIIFNSSLPDIGYIARTNTAGKELDMVNQFVEFLIKKYSHLKTKKVAIFIEPQIDTGYPDIVVVEYYSHQKGSWNTLRASLSCTDFKILYYIQTEKFLSLSDISETLGYPIDIVKKSVSKLNVCGLIHLSKKKEHVRNIRLKTYAKIHKIIAIEAKIDKWQEAIRQANNNIWFSTESYILMNKSACSPAIIQTCRSIGVGVLLVNGKVETILASTQRRFPVSYASLQFNEWILRYLHKEDIT